MNQRIKDVRKALGLTQEDFAARLGLTRGAITNIEFNKTEPKPLLVQLICKEFNVNEFWLRTGEGEMFIRKTRNDELAEFFGQLSQEDDSFKKRLISALSRLDVNSWEALEKFANDLFTKDGEEQA